MKMSIKVAIAGNPNSGKTTLFNQLTGSTARVGNWPGVTVESKEGKYTKMKEENITVVDLPGIYSLSPYSPEEVIARDYLLDQKPNVVINIVDATNLERNLYFTSQVMETECPMVIALNMIDVIEKNHDALDIAKLEQKLGVPVVPISASTNKGIDNLMKKVVEVSKQKREPKTILKDSPIYPAIETMLHALEQKPVDNKLFYAIKLVDNDKEVVKKLGSMVNNSELSSVQKEVASVGQMDDCEAIVADLRYKYITKNLSPLLKRSSSATEESVSDKVDKILTHKYLGIPIFLAFMWVVFHTTFSEDFLFLGINSPGVFLQGLTETIVEIATEGMVALLEGVGASDWAMGLVIDGIFAGIGSVLSFLPQILVLFLFLSIMEDSGYMSRAAFVMDRLLRGFGLSGKSFMPMIMGFGCSVPAIMGTRTIEREKDRVLTIMLIPFMSCGAKLPIHALIAAAFFPNNADTVVFGMYLFGIVMAIICGIILKNVLFKGDHAPFILELPPYRIPSLKSLMIHLWEKAKGFAIKAGTILTASVIIIWFLSNFNFSLQLLPEPNSAESMLGIMASSIKFIFAPLGFVSGPNGWMTVAAILTGFVAKEAVVTTMGQLYTPGLGDALEDSSAESALQASLLASFSPAAALSFLAYMLLTVPCFAAVAALSKEMGSRKYFWLTIAFQLIVSWVGAFMVFHVASLFL
jgi:ferrous iron transport protein B